MSEPDRSRRARARRWLPVLVAAGGVLAVATLALWPVYAEHQAKKVFLTWIGEPDCTGTRLVRRDANNGFGEQRRVTMIDGRPGMRCVISLRVHNGTGHAVTVRRVVGNYLGPGSGTVFKAAPVNGVRPRPGAEPDRDLEAYYPLGRTLPAGASTRAQVALVFRRSGCTADGWLYLRDWPAADLHLLGQDVTVTADRTLYVVGHQKFNTRCGD